MAELKGERAATVEASHLHAVGNEDLSRLLDHGLGFELLGGELALAWVKHLLARYAGQSQVCRVGLVAHSNLDGLWVNWTWCVAGRWQS